jgi:hypothetical protein
MPAADLVYLFCHFEKNRLHAVQLLIGQEMAAALCRIRQVSSSL